MAAKKKDSSVRARRNVASTRAVLSLAPDVEQPDLPAGREWHPLTCEWWSDLWSSPMAGEYHSSDRHALFILAALIDAFWIEPSKELAGEIRLQRTAFGLTPYDRRRLEWTIESAEEAKDRGNKRRTAAKPPPERKDDPREMLRMVD